MMGKGIEASAGSHLGTGKSELSEEHIAGTNPPMGRIYYRDAQSQDSRLHKANREAFLALVDISLQSVTSVKKHQY